jgi:DNA repair ATPase RecN
VRKACRPERPIRTGQDAAVVELTLSENLAPRYRVLRSWRANGDEAETRLTVYALDAEHKATIQSPQTVLDRLIGDLAFDPLAFVRADAREQVRLLLKAAGLEQQYAAAQRDRKAAYDQRTAVNAQLKQAEATMPVDPAPGETIEERTDADLRRLAAEINRHNAEVDLAERNLAQAAKAAETAADRVKRLEAELADAAATPRTPAPRAPPPRRSATRSAPAATPPRSSPRLARPTNTTPAPASSDNTASAPPRSPNSDRSPRP